jgi:hypothetical protein
MTDEVKSLSEAERIALEVKQRAFEHAHDIWAAVFSPLRPRRSTWPAAVSVGTFDVAGTLPDDIKKSDETPDRALPAGPSHPAPQK